jgi:hypothetical protein
MPRFSTYEQSLRNQPTAGPGSKPPLPRERFSPLAQQRPFVGLHCISLKAYSLETNPRDCCHPPVASTHAPGSKLSCATLSRNLELHGWTFGATVRERWHRPLLPSPRDAK